MPRFTRISLAAVATACVATVVALLALIGSRYYLVARSSNLFAEETQIYRRLVDQRPPDASPAEWENAVGWTLNLHGFCNYSSKKFPHDKYAQFMTELRSKTADGPVSLSTIDWVWDTYPLLNPDSQDYVNRNRPTTEASRRNAFVGQFGLAVR